jgi:hypothetical protein
VNVALCPGNRTEEGELRGHGGQRRDKCTCTCTRWEGDRTLRFRLGDGNRPGMAGASAQLRQVAQAYPNEVGARLT